MIIISVLFIAGGAFNDGYSGWTTALPFFFILYLALDTSISKKIVICLVLFVAMIGISRFEGTSPLVYPQIGQQVVLNENIPIVFRFNNWVYYPLLGTEGGSIVPKGDDFKVERYEIISNDFITQGLHAGYVLSDGKREFYVDNFDVPDFCKSVSWKYCSTYGKLVNVPTNGGVTIQEPSQKSPMVAPLRWLTSLVYYPLYLLIIFTNIGHLFRIP